MRTFNRAGSPAARLVLSLMLLVIVSNGCKKRIYTEIDLAEATGGEPAGLAVEAVYLSDAEEIEDLFGSFLPASGILPVLVAVRNDSDSPLRLHSRNSLPVGDSFASFVLEGSGRKLEPLHPLDVVMSLGSGKDKGSFKDVGDREVATGIMFPPLGAWYAWKEYEARKEYKPLIRSSLLTAEFGGTFRPLELSPGELASGYLFFRLDSTLVLYEEFEIKVVENEKEKTEKGWRLKQGADVDLVLRARPSLAGTEEEVGTLCAGDGSVVTDICFARRPAWTEDGGHLSGIFRVILTDGIESLVWTTVEIEADGDPLFRDHIVESYAGTGVTIADAELLGDRGVVAVNFTRKSKVMLIDLSGTGIETGKIRKFDRKVRKVYLAPCSGSSKAVPERAFAVTADGFCREVRSDGGGKYTKLGTGIDDTVVDSHGTLHAFSGGSVSSFSLATADIFARLPEVHIAESRVSVASVSGGRIFMKISGEKSGSDTLFVYDPERADITEGMRLPLTGEIVSSGPSRGGLVARMKDGTVLMITLVAGEGEGDLPRIERAFYLDEKAGLIAGAGDLLFFAGDEGKISFGKFDPWLPLLYDIESSVRLTPSFPPAGGGS